jgi:hypothetical protein
MGSVIICREKVLIMKVSEDVADVVATQTGEDAGERG